MEKELVQWLTETFSEKRNQIAGRPEHGSILADFLGIGDDAAVIESAGRRIVLTSDAIIENVHFDSSMTLQQIGRKALAVNLSDLASMAAEPVAAIVNLCLPGFMALDNVKQLYEGMSDLIEGFGLEIIGGDTNVGSTELILSITAIGFETENPVTRLSGAEADDKIVVSGSFGGSRAQKHFAFEPRCELALYLNKHFQINAATDVTDGLSLDLTRMATASGVGTVVDVATIPISEAIKSLESSQRLEKALGDGEDFELIFAIPADQVSNLLKDTRFGTELTVIGEFTNRPSEYLLRDQGEIRLMEPKGYLH